MKGPARREYVTPSLAILRFEIRGKPVERWYDFKVHRFVAAEPLRWVKVTVFYEGVVHGSYHVDCGAVASAYGPAVREKVEELRRKVRQMVMDEMKWWDWEEIEMSLGLRVGVAVEDDGEPEEWCEVWRV